MAVLLGDSITHLITWGAYLYLSYRIWKSDLCGVSGCASHLVASRRSGRTAVWGTWLWRCRPVLRLQSARTVAFRVLAHRPLWGPPRPFPLTANFTRALTGPQSAEVEDLNHCESAGRCGALIHIFCTARLSVSTDRRLLMSPAAYSSLPSTASRCNNQQRNRVPCVKTRSYVRTILRSTAENSFERWVQMATDTGVPEGVTTVFRHWQITVQSATVWWSTRREQKRKKYIIL
jgi:hypothetical protein